MVLARAICTSLSMTHGSGKSNMYKTYLLYPLQQYVQDLLIVSIAAICTRFTYSSGLYPLQQSDSQLIRKPVYWASGPVQYSPEGSTEHQLCFKTNLFFNISWTVKPSLQSRSLSFLCFFLRFKEWFRFREVEISLLWQPCLGGRETDFKLRIWKIQACLWCRCTGFDSYFRLQKHCYEEFHYWNA